MNALIVMAVGVKYLQYFETLRPQFEAYARKCRADLIVCSEPPDPAFKRNILAQKMLLPERYKAFDWIAFLDLDVLISSAATSIFDCIDETKAFAAVADPRGTAKFANVVRYFWRLPEILNETHQGYFVDRGFAPHPLLKASINGGAFLCKPSTIAGLFRDAYFSDLRETASGGAMIDRIAAQNDEAIMAYVSQTNNLFFELDERFNKQVIYQLYEESNSALIEKIGTPEFQALVRRHNNNEFPSSIYDYPYRYRKFVARELERCCILHFSAGFPFVNVLQQTVVPSRSW